MGTIATSVITARVRKTLIEPVARFWADAELLDYFNAGVTSLIKAKPDASVKVASLTLVAGPDQSMPADNVVLMDVLGTSSGLSCRKVKLTDLWHNIPNWRVVAQSANPRSYAYETDTPNALNVYPPASVGSTLTIKYSFLPARITSTATPIPVDDYYETALWAYVCSMAYAKNTVRGDRAKSDEYMALFMSELGISTQAKAAESPQASERVGAAQ